ncbi:succinate dehydrogenase / fumarate reductase cytochrome b subunit [Lewinella marina]|uniref:Succinate dehydrogenase n=1 Tax=Neolewinella marina TaxID=438751 RepID=A0A2G0CHV0_9BACT|nr:succinate dehydrogenase cytochrome b subunit [Neolewinella marina]NJB85356.1 succinate dehydrogenase / fumarate reductase cytochrome b subunit [Neolewinella marina]PHK99528.1 succinate dehydrogenase [Neolewinella marina]
MATSTANRTTSSVGWFGKFLSSSIGQKVIMSLTGLFLIVFLVVHLIGNLQLILANDEGYSFNSYAYFMTTNPVIKTTSFLLYAFIILHAIQGIYLWNLNRKARGNVRYAVKVDRTAGGSKSSIYMGSLGMVILAFIIVHMVQFWGQMHFTDNVGPFTAEGYEGAKDLYALVSQTYENIGMVIFYVVAMVFIAFHLWHGFQSAFQTLGLNHKKYTPLIKSVGYAYSVLVPLGFAAIPVIMYLRSRGIL